jgi:hypothetical protein
VREFTADGKLTMDFNQDLEIPALVKRADQSRRLSGSYDMIDMSKILMLTVVQKSEISTKDLKYFMTLQEWTSKYVVIGVNFTKPLMISAGSKNDQVKIDILDKIYFVSAESGEVIDPLEGFEEGA